MPMDVTGDGTGQKVEQIMRKKCNRIAGIAYNFLIILFIINDISLVMKGAFDGIIRTNLHNGGGKISA
jgi:hypothetical protein